VGKKSNYNGTKGRALITGITGFVGRHLSHQLDREGWKIFGIDLPVEKERIPEGVTEYESVDITNLSDLKKTLEKTDPQVIFHLAAQSSVSLSFQDPHPTFMVNLLGTLNLLEVLRHQPKKIKLLIVTSCDIYGSVPEKDLPIDEETPLHPESPYGVSKAAQDMLADQYGKTYDLPIIRLRPFPHTGPGQSPTFVLPNFAQQIAKIEKGKQEPILWVGNLEARRDFLDVRDVVRAYSLAQEKGEPGEAYNICSGKMFSIGEALKILLSFTEMEIEVRPDPHRLRPLDIPVLKGDGSKFRKKTGWEPKIPFEKTLEDLLNYWREKVAQSKSYLTSSERSAHLNSPS